MPGCLKLPRHGAVARCAVCNGKFGLVRYYWWQTPLCTKACVDRFRNRREGDRRWLCLLQTGVDRSPYHQVRVL